MTRARRLDYQFKNIIMNSECFGRAKHSDKRNNVSTLDKIYSYSESNNLYDTGKDFGKYIKENYPDVRFIYQITPLMTQQYLNNKMKTNNQNSLNQIAHRLEKLQLMACKVYNRSDFKFYDNTINKNKPVSNQKNLRILSMSEADYFKIIDTKRDSEWKIGVMLSHAFGLRVSEIPKIRVCDITGNSLHVEKSKGGRNRNIPITTDEQKRIISFLKDYASNNNKDMNDAILNIKVNSLNKGLNQRMKKLGITTYTDAKTSFHAIRKSYCIREYENRLPNDWDTSKLNLKAWDEVSSLIGHGKGRTDLAKIYLTLP